MRRLIVPEAAERGPASGTNATVAVSGNPPVAANAPVFSAPRDDGGSGIECRRQQTQTCRRARHRCVPHRTSSVYAGSSDPRSEARRMPLKAKICRRIRRFESVLLRACKLLSSRVTVKPTYCLTRPRCLSRHRLNPCPLFVRTGSPTARDSDQRERLERGIALISARLTVRAVS